MKQIAFLLIAMAFPAAVFAQGLPENPAPAAANSSPIWSRVEQLPRGEKIKVSYGRGPWDRCRFAGATEAYLFCEPGDDSGWAQPYQIDRASIFDVKIDHDERNGRLVFAAFVVAGGVWAGFQAAKTTDSGAAVFGGFLGAGLGALAGLPASCIAGHCVAFPPPPPVYGFGYNVPLSRFTGRFGRGLR